MIKMLLATVSLLLCEAPHAFAQDGYQGATMSPRQHGYEHGYQDGYQSTRGSRLSNRDQDIRNQQQKAQGNGYQPSFGSEMEYSEGYKQGFSDGADDSQKGVPSRVEQLFRPLNPSYNPDRDRNDPSVGVYRSNGWAPDHIAQDIGYRDGINAGIQDRRARLSYQAHSHGAWKNGLHGYDPAQRISSKTYRMTYRLAYENGYSDGYGQVR